MTSLQDILIENPVIAAIRSPEDLEDVLGSKVQIVFVLYGSILTLSDICLKLTEARKTVFVHMDMIEGLKGDASGVEFVRKAANPFGIVSTKTNIIKYAKQMHLGTILRIFLVDSHSLKTGIKNVLETNPDAVEIMPGIACKAIAELEKQISVPVIAGGLIDNKDQVYEILSGGAVAISTSKRDLWQ